MSSSRILEITFKHIKNFGSNETTVDKTNTRQGKKSHNQLTW